MIRYSQIQMTCLKVVCCEEKKKVVLVYSLDTLTRLCEQFKLAMAGQLIDALYETGAHSDLIITC